TVGRRSELRRAEKAASDSLDARRFWRRTSLTIGAPCFAEPSALTTVPKYDRGRSPDDETKPPSPDLGTRTRGKLGLLLAGSGLTPCPVASTAVKYLPSSLKCAASSRASTVFGDVPAAMKTARAGNVISSPSCQVPSSARTCLRSASACAAPKRSIC